MEGFGFLQLMNTAMYRRHIRCVRVGMRGNSSIQGKITETV